MRKILVPLLGLLLATAYASAQSISVSVKPPGSISGTISFNIHEDETVTLLVYESPSQISENTLPIDAEIRSSISQNAQSALKELVALEDFASLPEFSGTVSVSVTESGVTKSVSTKRYSGQIWSLLEQMRGVLPEGITLPLRPE